MLSHYEQLADQCLGHVVLFDSRRPETFKEARVIFETTKWYAPDKVILAATNTDEPDGWSLDDLQIELRGILPAACDVTSAGSIKNTILTLLEIVPYSPLVECIKDYLTAI